MLALLSLIALLLLSPLSVAANGHGIHGAGASERILVRIAVGIDPARGLAYLRSHDLEVIDSARLGPLVIFAITAGAHGDRGKVIAELSATGLFAYAVPDRDLEAPSRPERFEPVTLPPVRERGSRLMSTFPPNDPLFAEQYALQNRGERTGSTYGADIDIEGAWEITEGDSSVVVAVSEEGFDGNHPDLTGQFVRDSAQFAAANNGFWHGTMVAGIIAAKKGNGEGIAGIAPGCRLLVIHNDYGTSSLAVLKALEKVLAWNATVYTNSWGFAQASLQPLQEAYDVVARTGRGGKGTLIVFATGNDGQSWVNYPAWFDRFVAVGATTREDRRWDLSNFGRELDLCAPGGDIISTANNGGYARAWGTSLSAPMVAGVAALIASANPALGADSIRALLELTCDKVGGYRFDSVRVHGLWSPYVGYGRINAQRAVRMARGLADSRPRLVWPRGGEIFRSGESALLRWSTDRPSKLLLRAAAGDTTLAVTSGNDSLLWSPGGSDTLRLLLVDAGSGNVLDSLERPMIVRGSHYTVSIDTAAPFVSLDDYRQMGKVGVIVRDRHVYPLPFDFLIGSDTTWSWSADAHALVPYRSSGYRLDAQSAPPVDPQITGRTGIFGLLLNDIAGVDSIRFGVVGAPPAREGIIELDGLRFDSLLAYPAGMRSALAGYRRQVRFHELDGTISFHYDRPLELRPDDPSLTERPALLAALETSDELIAPFGDGFLRRLPAGSVTITPKKYARPSTSVRSAVISADAEETYGYDVHHVTFVANMPEATATLRGSTDFGASWRTMVQTPSSDGAFAALIPPRFAGSLVLALGGNLDRGWRDTLLVYDPGYVIEPIAGDPSPIIDDPRATSIVFDADGTAEIPLPFSFRYFGYSCSALSVFRSGRVAPLVEGDSGEYAMIKASPRPTGIDPDSLATVRFLYLDEGERSATVIEWDSLARYLPEGASAAERRSSFSQLRIWSDGTIDFGYGTPAQGSVPYFFFPSLAYGPYVLISPDFTLKSPLTTPIQLPLRGYRYLPHTPLSDVDRSEAVAADRSSLHVFPNPTAGSFRIIRSAGTGPWSVTVATPLGQIVATLGGTGSVIEGTTDGLPQGLYLIRESGSGQGTSMMILR